MRDYWIAATVRIAGATPNVQYALWTARFQASDIAAARRAAVQKIANDGMEYGELQMLWDSCPAIVVPSDEALADVRR